MIRSFAIELQASDGTRQMFGEWRWAGTVHHTIAKKRTPAIPQWREPGAKHDWVFVP
jgi:hypothetical protein